MIQCKQQAEDNAVQTVQLMKEVKQEQLLKNNQKTAGFDEIIRLNNKLIGELRHVTTIRQLETLKQRYDELTQGIDLYLIEK